MRYTISEMANLLGVTTHMLRHYEKMGIIRPEVDLQNGYRYYSVIETRRFNLSRSLVSCGVPLEKCARILSDMDYADLEAYIEEKQREQQHEIERLRLCVNYMESLKEVYGKIDEGEAVKIHIENLPRMWRLNLSKREHPTLSNELKQERNKWLSCLPAVRWVSRIPSSVLEQFAEGEIDYEYGLMCHEQNALALGLRKTKHIEAVPGGDYLVSIHRKIERGPYVWDDIRIITDYLKERGLSFFGDAFSSIVASRIENGVVANYHQIYLKIYT